MVDRFLSYDPASNLSLDTLKNDLECQLRDVSQRSLVCSYSSWVYEAGWVIKKRRSQYGLDPTEDVDASNWLEKGYFRRSAKRIFQRRVHSRNEKRRTTDTTEIKFRKPNDEMMN